MTARLFVLVGRNLQAVAIFNRVPQATTSTAIPTMAELRQVIPAECFERSTGRSMLTAAVSVALTVGTGAMAWALLPLSWLWLPAWVLYAVVAGTFATGVWVVAHECGHGAFSDNAKLQGSVGFVLHSSLLVPYFSWQRSHAIHHAKTNHLTEGETHVPRRADSSEGQRLLRSRARMGAAHPPLTLASRLLFGWPVYLLTGATGGPERGVTNHFWPWKPFSRALFPQRWVLKVAASAVGVVTMLFLLVFAATQVGVATVVALYVGPYLVCNAWLVTYTWLQHTNHDIPHYSEDEWSYVRGAFCSVDRPYGRIIDAIHHRIGSTHVAHHLFHKIPHYKAKLATDAIAAEYPDLYRYDDTPVLLALWRASADCIAVAPETPGSAAFTFTAANGSSGSESAEGLGESELGDVVGVG